MSDDLPAGVEECMDCGALITAGSAYRHREWHDRWEPDNEFALGEDW